MTETELLIINSIEKRKHYKGKKTNIYFEDSILILEYDKEVILEIDFENESCIVNFHGENSQGKRTNINLILENYFGIKIDTYKNNTPFLNDVELDTFVENDISRQCFE